MLICVPKAYFTQTLKTIHSFAKIATMAEGLNLTWNNGLKSCEYKDFITFFSPKNPKHVSIAGVSLSFLSACFTRPLCTDWYTWKGHKRERTKKNAEGISENIIKQPEVLTHAVTIQSWKLGHRRENDRVWKTHCLQ